MTRHELLTLCETIRGELLPGFPEIQTVRFSISNRYTRSLGRARYCTGEVILSGPAYVAVSLNDHLAPDTVRHELAHIVAWRRHAVAGHGHTWQRLAVSMGCTGDRCTLGVKLGNEVTLSCGACGHQTEERENTLRRWHRKGSRAMCPKCLKGLPFPWERSVMMAAAETPKRILIQRG